MLKYLLRSFPPLQSFSPFIILITGALEAIEGLRQLYGFTSSNHGLFRLTGSFFTPGPFSGYLAVVLPLCLGFILRLRPQSGIPFRMVYYLAWGALLLSLLVLPGRMSRTPWIAAILSCSWVYWNYQGGYGICQMKKDSAHGRVWIWKVTALSICEQSFKGTGLGGFPAAYAKTQAGYFA